MHIHIQEDQLLAIFSLPGGPEWIIILVIGLLLFGKRLPEIARSMGKGIVEFKKGLRDVEDEIEKASSSADPDNSSSSYGDTGYGEDAYGGESDGNSDGDSDSDSHRDSGSDSHSDSDASTRQNYEEIYGQSEDEPSAESEVSDSPTEPTESTEPIEPTGAATSTADDATSTDDVPSTDEVPAESKPEQ